MQDRSANVTRLARRMPKPSHLPSTRSSGPATPDGDGSSGQADQPFAGGSQYAASTRSQVVQSEVQGSEVHGSDVQGSEAVGSGVAQPDDRAPVPSASAMSPAGQHVTASRRPADSEPQAGDGSSGSAIVRSDSRREMVAEARRQIEPLSPSAVEPLRTPVEIPGTLTFPKRKYRWVGPTIFFLLIVVGPLCGLTYYLYVVASPQYVSEFRFSVTQVTPSSGTLPAAVASASSADLSSIASALSGGATGGTSSASPQNFVVVDYLKSREAVDELQARINLRAMYSRSDIDPWFRLKANATPEELTDYWRGMVTADYDMVSGLATASVKAFRKQDAYVIAKELVTLSEQLVNRIENRAQQDAVRFAKGEVSRAQTHLNDVRKKLADFREKEGVIDPTNATGEVTSNVNLASSVATTLAQAETTLETMKKQNLNRNSVLIQMQEATVKAAREQLDSVQKQVSKKRDGKPVLTRVVSQYEALDLDRQYAQALLLNAYQSLDRARASAASQQFYLTPYVRPALPGSPRGLHALRYILIATFSLLAIWVAAVMIFRSIRNSFSY